MDKKFSFGRWLVLVAIARWIAWTILCVGSVALAAITIILCRSSAWLEDDFRQDWSSHPAYSENCPETICLPGSADDWEGVEQYYCPETEVRYAGDDNAVCSPEDNDGDGIFNIIDNCVAVRNQNQLDLNRATPEGAECEDSDDDGVLDIYDNCLFVQNPVTDCYYCDLDFPLFEQYDIDEDYIGDACDCDMDGDGINNPASLGVLYGPGGTADVCVFGTDNCPKISSAASYQGDYDADGRGDICDDCPADVNNDGDYDGVCESWDNCPTVYNPPIEYKHHIRQADTDEDGIGDACESATNGDQDSLRDDNDHDYTNEPAHVCVTNGDCMSGAVCTDNICVYQTNFFSRLDVTWTSDATLVIPPEVVRLRMELRCWDNSFNLMFSPGVDEFADSGAQTIIIHIGARLLANLDTCWVDIAGLDGLECQADTLVIWHAISPLGVGTGRVSYALDSISVTDVRIGPNRLGGHVWMFNIRDHDLTPIPLPTIPSSL